MKVKAGTTIRGLNPEMQIANAKASVIYRQHNQELWITAGVDPTGHTDTSFHPKGDACDWRTRYFKDQAEKIAVRDELQEELGYDYDVVLESDHIHCEFDPK